MKRPLDLAFWDDSAEDFAFSSCDDSAEESAFPASPESIFGAVAGGGV